MTLFVIILFIPLAYATLSSDEYLNCTAKKILHDCNNGIIGINCKWENDSTLCYNLLEHNTENINAYLSKFESENLKGISNIINSPILVCKIDDKVLTLKYKDAYIWDNIKIDCPKKEITNIDNSINLETQGPNSTINYQDNRKTTYGNNSPINDPLEKETWPIWLTKTIIGAIIVAIIGIKIKNTNKTKKIKRKKIKTH